MDRSSANGIIDLLIEVGLINELLNTYTYTDLGDKCLISIASGMGSIKIETSDYGGLNFFIPLLVVHPQTALAFLSLKEKVSGFLTIKVRDETSAYISYAFTCDTKPEAIKKAFSIAKKEMINLRELALLISSSLEDFMDDGELSREDKLMDMLLGDEDEELDEEGE